MIEYLAEYKDKSGERHKYYVTSTDVRTAMNNLFELCPDCVQIISCRPKPMFED